MTTEIICPGIDEYMKPFFGYFHRSESRELAENYVTGLLMDGERKSVEPMSEKVNASERSMQRLLSDVKWDDRVLLPNTDAPCCPPLPTLWVFWFLTTPGFQRRGAIVLVLPVSTAALPERPTTARLV